MSSDNAIKKEKFIIEFARLVRKYVPTYPSTPGDMDLLAMLQEGASVYNPLVWNPAFNPTFTTQESNIMLLKGQVTLSIKSGWVPVNVRNWADFILCVEPSDYVAFDEPEVVRAVDLWMLAGRPND